MMKRITLVIIVVALYILHQDFWNWRETTPIVFGFLPIGLFYHICYTIAVSFLMYLLVKFAWPSHLEETGRGGESGGQGGEKDGTNEQGDKVATKQGEASILAFTPTASSQRPLFFLSSNPHSFRPEGCD
jgi:hypothetical protein